jgi:hypothetical protein
MSIFLLGQNQIFLYVCKKRVQGAQVSVSPPAGLGTSLVSSLEQPNRRQTMLNGLALSVSIP